MVEIDQLEKILKERMRKRYLRNAPTGKRFSATDIFNIRGSFVTLFRAIDVNEGAVTVSKEHLAELTVEEIDECLEYFKTHFNEPELLGWTAMLSYAEFYVDYDAFVKIYGTQLAEHLWNKFVNLYGRDLLRLFANLDQDNKEKCVRLVIETYINTRKAMQDGMPRQGGGDKNE